MEPKNQVGGVTVDGGEGDVRRNAGAGGRTGRLPPAKRGGSFVGGCFVWLRMGREGNKGLSSGLLEGGGKEGWNLESVVGLKEAG